MEELLPLHDHELGGEDARGAQEKLLLPLGLLPRVHVALGQGNPQEEGGE